MTIAQGVSKKVAVKRETEWGVLPGPTNAKYLRRTSSDLSMNKDTFESKEIRSDGQIAVFGHGMRKVEGTLNGELAPGAYADFFAALLRNEFYGMAGSASGTGIAATATGFDIPDVADSGFVAGHVVKCAGFNAAANNNRHFLITEVTAGGINGVFLDGAAIVPEAAGANVTITVDGGETQIFEGGHTDVSFAAEHWFQDIGQSEVFTGLKVDEISLKFNPTGMAEISVKFMGRDMVPGTAQYFTNPEAAGTTNAVTAVAKGVRLYAVGKRIQLLTGLDLTIKTGLTTEPVIGSDVAPFLFRGPLRVNGSMTAFFEDGELRDAFLQEDEIAIFGAFKVGPGANAPVFAFRLPRVKLGGAQKDDGDKGIVQSVPFVALKADNGGTTIAIQDTAVTPAP